MAHLLQVENVCFLLPLFLPLLQFIYISCYFLRFTIYCVTSAIIWLPLILFYVVLVRKYSSNPSTPARKYRVSTSDTRYFCFQNRSTTLIFTLIGTKYPYFMTESRRIGKFRRFFYAFFSMLVSKNFCILLALSRFICSVAWTYRCKVKAAVA